METAPAANAGVRSERGAVQEVEVITGVARRRRFTTEQKLLVVNETLQPGLSISYVARRLVEWSASNSLIFGVPHAV
jgi:hypothetical protein